MASASDVQSAAQTNKILVAPPGVGKQVAVSSLFVSTAAQNTVSMESGLAEITTVDIGAATGGTWTITVAGQEFGTKEVMTVHRGAASGGTFTLTVNSQETGTIAWDASAGTVDTAVQALTIVTATTVTGTGTSGDPWIITFDNPIGPLTVTGNGAALTPTDTLSVVETTPGAALAFDISAATLETNVESLSTVAAAGVTGTGSTADPWIITITDPATSLAISGTGTLLTASDTLTLTETLAGGTTLKRRAYLPLDGHIEQTAGKGDELFRCGDNAALTYTSTASAALFVDVQYKKVDSSVAE